MKAHAHILLSLAVFISACTTHIPDSQEQGCDSIETAVKLDLEGLSDSVLTILDPIFHREETRDLDDYLKLVYCRNLFAAGRVREADSLYDVYIKGAQVDSIKAPLVSEYLTLLVKSEQYDRACEYADTLVLCCSDDSLKYFDLAVMCYVVRAANKHECKKFRNYLDSLEGILGRIRSRIVTSETLNDWKAHYNKTCSEE